jgi:hypothetical protein
MNDTERWVRYAQWEAGKPSLLDRPKRKLRISLQGCPKGILWASAIEALAGLLCWFGWEIWGK